MRLDQIKFVPEPVRTLNNMFWYDLLKGKRGSVEVCATKTFDRFEIYDGWSNKLYEDLDPLMAQCILNELLGE